MMISFLYVLKSGQVKRGRLNEEDCKKLFHKVVGKVQLFSITFPDGDTYAWAYYTENWFRITDEMKQVKAQFTDYDDFPF